MVSGLTINSFSNKSLQFPHFIYQISLVSLELCLKPASSDGFCSSPRQEVCFYTALSLHVLSVLLPHASWVRSILKTDTPGQKCVCGCVSVRHVMDWQPLQAGFLSCSTCIQRKATNPEWGYCVRDNEWMIELTNIWENMCMTVAPKAVFESFLLEYVTSHWPAFLNNIYINTIIKLLCSFLMNLFIYHHWRANTICYQAAILWPTLKMPDLSLKGKYKHFFFQTGSLTYINEHLNLFKPQPSC